MSSLDPAWLRYADLQERSRKTPHLNDYTWGIEAALNYLLKAIENGTVPSDPAVLDAALDRVIASRARLRRSHSLSCRKWMQPNESASIDASAEANVELARIERTVKPTDKEILFDAGAGYTDREIAGRNSSTPGAIRVRLSRLRLKLAKPSLSEPAILVIKQNIRFT